MLCGKYNLTTFLNKVPVCEPHTYPVCEYASCTHQTFVRKKIVCITQSSRLNTLKSTWNPFLNLVIMLRRVEVFLTTPRWAFFIATG